MKLPTFTMADAMAAGAQWGFNCGPAVLAMLSGKTPEELRPYLGDFESKRYTNPTLMFECLNQLGVDWKPRKRWLGDSGSWFSDGLDAWPSSFGICRVQWHGPWMEPGVPIRVRYRHTHWIGAFRMPGEEPSVFDINAMNDGGWIPLSIWRDQLVPWLLEQCEPKANGHWSLTHVLEVSTHAKA